MRLFIAINFTDEIKDQLLKHIHELRREGAEGNFTRRENLHLTLAFIGETNRVESAKQAMVSACEQNEATTLTIGGHGCFNDILWCAVAKNPQLDLLANQLKKQLTTSGFKIDSRPFKPHITLIRRYIPGSSKPNIPEMSMKVTHISLMKSERINGKLTYTELYKTALTTH